MISLSRHGDPTKRNYENAKHRRTHNKASPELYYFFSAHPSVPACYVIASPPAPDPTELCLGFIKPARFRKKEEVRHQFYDGSKSCTPRPQQET